MKRFSLVLMALIMSFVMIGSNIIVLAENNTQAAPAATAAPNAAVQATQKPAATPATEKAVDEIYLKVNLDGSSTLSYSGVIDKKYHAMLKQQYGPMGYKIESIKMGLKKDKDALRLTKSTSKDKPFNLSMPGQDETNFQALKVKRWFYDLYVMNAKYDMSQYPTSDTLMNVKVTLPVFPSYTNAVSHSWNNYTWQLKGQKNNSVDFIVLIPNFLNIAILIILIAIILLIISLVRNNKRKSALMEDEVLLNEDELLTEDESEEASDEISDNDSEESPEGNTEATDVSEDKADSEDSTEENKEE